VVEFAYLLAGLAMAGVGLTLLTTCTLPLSIAADKLVQLGSFDVTATAPTTAVASGDANDGAVR